MSSDSCPKLVFIIIKFTSLLFLFMAFANRGFNPSIVQATEDTACSLPTDLCQCKTKFPLF